MNQLKEAERKATELVYNARKGGCNGMGGGVMAHILSVCIVTMMMMMMMMGMMGMMITTVVYRN